MNKDLLLIVFIIAVFANISFQIFFGLKAAKKVDRRKAISFYVGANMSLVILAMILMGVLYL